MRNLLFSLFFVSCSISSFAYDEILLDCKVSGKMTAGTVLKEYQTTNLTASIRIAKEKVGIIISGENSPFGAPLVVLGFSGDMGHAILEGKNFTNKQKYSVNSMTTDKSSGAKLYSDIEISRVTGEIRILTDDKSLGAGEVA